MKAQLSLDQGDLLTWDEWCKLDKEGHALLPGLSLWGATLQQQPAQESGHFSHLQTSGGKNREEGEEKYNSWVSATRKRSSLKYSYKGLHRSFFAFTIKVIAGLVCTVKLEWTTEVGVKACRNKDALLYILGYSPVLVGGVQQWGFHPNDPGKVANCLAGLLLCPWRYIRDHD